MSEQSQGMCLSKYMKNCKKKKNSRILLIFFLYDKNVIFTKITTTRLQSIGINMYTNETGLRLGSRKDLYSS